MKERVYKRKVRNDKSKPRQKYDKTLPKEYKNYQKVFFDTEFTGLHKNTTLISIGIICGEKTFYAELNDYDKNQINEWLQDNVISKLSLQNQNLNIAYENGGDTTFYGDKSSLKNVLEDWLSQFGNVQVWSDCLSYDWVLFNDIFGTAFDIPKNVYYIPFDICTSFMDKNIDPDISREEFVNEKSESKHNSLHDARIIQKCYNKIYNL